MKDACTWSGLQGNQVVDVRENKDYIVQEVIGIGNKMLQQLVINKSKNKVITSGYDNYELYASSKNVVYCLKEFDSP